MTGSTLQTKRIGGETFPNLYKAQDGLKNFVHFIPAVERIYPTAQHGFECSFLKLCLSSRRCMQNSSFLWSLTFFIIEKKLILSHNH